MSLHEEDYKSALVKLGVWAGNNKQLVMFGAIFLIAFVLGAYSCSAKAATITFPTCDTLTVKSNVNDVITLACGHTPKPPAPPPASACTLPQLRVDVGPASSSTWTSGWNSGDVLVVSFVAPASGNGRLQLSNGGPPYDMRYATLSASPCGPAMATNNSQTPSVNMQAGGTAKPYGPVLLTPGTRYYWSVYNRNPDGSNSCNVGVCDMRVDFSAFR
jgi:hypothetical protein